MKNKKAFTLVELMVGMGIVAVLSAMSVILVQTALRAQRNAERRSTIDALDLTIREHFNNNRVYPSNSQVVWTANAVTVGTGSQTISLPLDGSLTPLSTTGAPTTSGGTRYCYQTVTGGYSLGVRLEGGGTYYKNSSSDVSSNCTL